LVTNIQIIENTIQKATQFSRKRYPSTKKTIKIYQKLLVILTKGNLNKKTATSNLMSTGT